MKGNVEDYLRVEAGEKTPEIKGTKFEESKTKSNSICEYINDKEYELALGLIKEYLNKDERILYSEISNYIFGLDTTARFEFISNTNDFAIYSSEIANQEENKILLKCVTKIYDHIQLVNFQKENMEKQVNELDGRIKSHISSVKKQIEDDNIKIKADFEKELDSSYKNMQMQLISLVGMFTALAFIIFGGLSSLGSVFNGVKDIPLLKIVVVASVWGISLLNLIYLFMFLISKISKLSENLNEPVKSKKLFIGTNIILLTVLGLSSWAYFIQENLTWQWVIICIDKNIEVVTLGGFVVIILAAIIGFKFYCDDKKQTEFEK